MYYNIEHTCGSNRGVLNQILSLIIVGMKFNWIFVKEGINRTEYTSVFVFLN